MLFSDFYDGLLEVYLLCTAASMQKWLLGFVITIMQVTFHASVNVFSVKKDNRFIVNNKKTIVGGWGLRQTAYLMSLLKEKLYFIAKFIGVKEIMEALGFFQFFIRKFSMVPF